jgi:hypothetical protein
MDRIPDELLQKMLNYAMTCDAPFYMEGCIRATKAVESKTQKSEQGNYSKAAKACQLSPDPAKALVGVLEGGSHFLFAE